jgi:hypothetical protein
MPLPVLPESVVATLRDMQGFDLEAQPLAPTNTEIPGGGVRVTYAAQGARIPARLAPVDRASADELVALGRTTTKPRFHLSLPHTSDIADSWQVDVYGPGWVRRMRVVGRRTPRSVQVITKLVVEAV